MTSTPRSAGEESLNESWVDVSGTHPQSTPVHLSGKGLISSSAALLSMERLLWEAQKESADSSLVASGRNSHSISPKSATSPVYPINSISPDSLSCCKEGLITKMIDADFLWDWSSRHIKNEQLLKEWKLSQYSTKQNAKLNLRQWAVRRGIFSKEVLSLLLLTNILSLILGAGLGYAILVRRTL